MKEEDFYEPFAEYLKNDLDEVTTVASFGGSGLKGKWGTPDVIGVYKSLASNLIKFPLEIVAAEIALGVQELDLEVAVGMLDVGEGIQGHAPPPGCRVVTQQVGGGGASRVGGGRGGGLGGSGLFLSATRAGRYVERGRLTRVGSSWLATNWTAGRAGEKYE